MNSFYELFLYFFIYSFIGWCAEMIYCRLYDGKWSDRGFLYGPYCPIYGFGGVIIVVCLEPFANSIALVFLLAMLLTTILEYITSFLMEKIFDAKWWDYSKKLLNINGRVCLLNSVLFGLMGIILIYIVQPYITKFINLIPASLIEYIVLFLVIVLTVDFTRTSNSLLNFKDKLKEIEAIKMPTKESLKEKSDTTNKLISEKLDKLKQSLIERRLKRSDRRIVKAFPHLKFNKLDNAFEELKKYIDKQTQERLKEKENKKLQRKNKSK